MNEAQSLAMMPAVTPLHAMHVARGAHMALVEGYELPLHYVDGAAAEHLHTREAAGLFDISHLGQLFLIGADHEAAARALEALVPGDILNLTPGGMRYTQLLTGEGGILDDMLVTRSADSTEDGALMLVVNSVRKDADFAHLSSQLAAGVRILRADHRALIALQGPMAAEVMARHAPDTREMKFMTAMTTRFDGIDCHVSRSGFTGEDGFEISAKAQRIVAIAERLLDARQVKLAGFAARETLRLEAGLCRIGQDIDETTTPVAAGLEWSIDARRRSEGGFPGAARVLSEIAEGTPRLRVGLKLEGSPPAGQNMDIRTPDGTVIGRVTSTGFGPTLNAPIAMGYVDRAFAAPGTTLTIAASEGQVPAMVAPLPFVPHKYQRG